jgi:hypothetical protein
MLLGCIWLPRSVLHCFLKRRLFSGTFPCNIPYLSLIAHRRSILTRVVVLWTNWGLGFLYFTMQHVSPLHMNFGMNVLSEPVSQESLIICYSWLSAWPAVKQYSLFYSQPFLWFLEPMTGKPLDWCLQ